MEFDAVCAAVAYYDEELSQQDWDGDDPQIKRERRALNRAWAKIATKR